MNTKHIQGAGRGLGSRLVHQHVSGNPGAGQFPEKPEGLYTDG